MIPSKDKYPENVVNPNFQSLLDKFHKLIIGNPSPSSIKSNLAALNEESKVTHLTGHQKDAICARVNNFIKGIYESTSRKYEVHKHVKV